MRAEGALAIPELSGQLVAAALVLLLLVLAVVAVIVCARPCGWLPWAKTTLKCLAVLSRTSIPLCCSPAHPQSPAKTDSRRPEHRLVRFYSRIHSRGVDHSQPWTKAPGTPTDGSTP